MNRISKDTQKVLESMQRAVNKALDKKKKLGQYAVVWRDNRPVAIGEDAPISLIEDNK